MSRLLAAVLQPMRYNVNSKINRYPFLYLTSKYKGPNPVYFRLVVQGLHTIAQAAPRTALVKPELFSFTSKRTKVRCYFPRPNEVRRVRRHGWETRMSTPNGRKVIMRRMLKGRFVLSH